MPRHTQRFPRPSVLLTACLTTMLTGLLMSSVGCQSGSSAVMGNESGSEPVNDSEANEYKKAIVRCYKTGGTRVVKVMGSLKCY